MAREKRRLLRVISGLLKPASGSIQFHGQHVGQDAAHKIVELGISQVPEGGKVFTGMSVLENLELGAFVAKPGRSKMKASSGCTRIFPAPGRKEEPTRGNAERRRAADAGDWPGFDVQAQTVDAG